MTELGCGVGELGSGMTELGSGMSISKWDE